MLSLILFVFSSSFNFPSIFQNFVYREPYNLVCKEVLFFRCMVICLSFLKNLALPGNGSNMGSAATVPKTVTKRSLLKKVLKKEDKIEDFKNAAHSGVIATNKEQGCVFSNLHSHFKKKSFLLEIADHKIQMSSFWF